MVVVYISELIYADDIVLLARSPSNLQRNLDILNSALVKRNMIINQDKTKTMVISRNKTDCKVKLIDKELEQVENFKYLGVNFSEDGKIMDEINSRLLNTGRLYHAINRGFIGKKEISQKTKMAVYNSIYIPTLIYGSEAWITTEKQKQKIQTAEMKYLRRVVGKTKRDKIRNQTIRTSLDIQPLQDRVYQAQLRWFGHLNRMDDQRIAKRAWEARLGGLDRNRPRGRPRKTWDDSIQELLKNRKVTWERAKKMSLNRKEWRALCKTSTPIGIRGTD